uniref:(northern house mosquito) hypothetical protein n=1 Tax=Culex pipiens TaxID=7175 RepID=A0A8D8ETV2_CULPI
MRFPAAEFTYPTCYPIHPTITRPCRCTRTGGPRSSCPAGYWKAPWTPLVNCRHRWSSHRRAAHSAVHRTMPKQPTGASPATAPRSCPRFPPRTKTLAPRRGSSPRSESRPSRPATCRPASTQSHRCTSSNRRPTAVRHRPTPAISRRPFQLECTSSSSTLM